MRRPTKIKGFTLVELILVITILGVISVSIVQVIAISAEIYMTGAERARLVAQARFTILRLEKEIRNTVPNSITFDAASGCLSYYPIKVSGTYVEDAFQNPLRAVVFDASINDGDSLVIYPTSPQSITDNARRIDTATVDLSKPAVPAQMDLLLNAPNTQTSPGKRFFVYDDQVSICLASNAQGNVLQRTQSGQSGLLATNITRWEANVVTADLKRNGLIALSLTFEGNDNEQLSVQHEVHFPNVP